MASKNANAAAALEAAFNDRDWDRIRGLIAEDCIFTEPAGEHKGPDGYVESGKAWVSAFSDASATDVRIHDAGERVIVELVGTGTNDGPLGELPATGKRATLPMCEVYKFGPDGKIVAGRAYYDQLTLLNQLGHAQG